MRDRPDRTGNTAATAPATESAPDRAIPPSRDPNPSAMLA